MPWTLVIECLQALAGILVLIYLPGFLVLRLIGFRPHIWSVRWPFEIGMSLGLLMTVGATINGVYPLLGISEPLGRLSVVITVFTVITMLLVLNLIFRRQDKAQVRVIHNHELSAIDWCLPALAPFMAVAAATTFSLSGDNRLMVALFVYIIGLTIMFGVRSRSTDADNYPFILLMIAMSLLLARTMISQYVAGWDIQWEYFYAYRTIDSGVWDASDATSQLNSTLSVVVLPAILSHVTGIPLTWVFKIVYPFFLGLVPVILYETYRRYVSRQQAFYSSAFVIFLNVFYFALPQAARMEVAFLLLALIIYLLFAQVDRVKRAILLMVFIGALVVAHYSTAYIFVAWAALSSLVLIAAQRFASRWYRRPAGRVPVGTNLLLIATIFSYTWYVYTSDGITFREGVGVLKWSWQRLDSLFALGSRNPMVDQALSGAQLSMVDQVARFLYLGTVSLLILGFVTEILNRRSKFALSYLAFATGAMAILIGSVALPVVSIAYDTGRTYLQALMVLAPFFVLGVYRLADAAHRWLARFARPRFNTATVGSATTVVLLGCYFAFQVGLASAVAGYPSTFVLDSRGTEYDTLYVYAQEVAAAEWLHRTQPDAVVYADAFGWMRLWSYGQFSRQQVLELPSDGSPLPGSGVIYLRHLNATKAQITMTPPDTTQLIYAPLVLPDSVAGNEIYLATIYDAGGSRIMSPLRGHRLAVNASKAE